MAISVADNFSYLGGKPLDGRIQYDTVANMKAMADAKLYEGCEAYCIATDKYYKWKSTNTVDETLGKWREIESGGGSIADFTGATDQDDGAHGLVPAPQAGDEGKVLFGNGSWGNIVMPSVDYSQQSVEANIFDTNEKVIGQWTDGKLLYQKTIIDTYPNTSGVQTLAEKQIEHGIANIDKIINVSGFHGTSVNAAVDYIAPENLLTYQQALHANATYLWIRNSNPYWNGNSTYVTLRYTKTTDSPLASGEKFAGLTASGEVIYKKEFTGSFTFTWNSEFRSEYMYDADWSGIQYPIKGWVLNTEKDPTEGYYKYQSMPVCINKSTNQRLELYGLSGGSFNKLILYYTKAS